MENTNHDYYRGEIYYADLNPVFGHEQGGYRPVLILQNDLGNYFSPTVIVTAATRRISKKAGQPTHVTLRDIEGLPGQSQFQLETLRTVDKRRLRERVGRLTDNQMSEIDAALRVSLYLGADAFLPAEADAP
ncbi:MAG: type II toxin-antitoxin system PemK/MazF family toxin [Oscillospiraceae bacterium]|nr:type II toxin-antitoxin system PemK/MazF family toxin [Oscillospiraceae bacterium]MCD8373811.1 type II toxin-antitoxin system PemK/MazF family toxin [Oscillospiraceae bacterium]